MTMIKVKEFKEMEAAKEFTKIDNFYYGNPEYGQSKYLSVYEDKNGNKFFVIEMQEQNFTYHTVKVLNKEELDALYEIFKDRAEDYPRYKQAIELMDKYKNDPKLDYDYAKNHLQNIIKDNMSSMDNDVDGNDVVYHLDSEEDVVNNDFDTDLDFAQYNAIEAEFDYSAA
jgi:hypothetical protein